MAKICKECGSPRGTPHKDDCSGAAHRLARQEDPRCAACGRNVSNRRHHIISCNSCNKRYFACCDEHAPVAQQMTNGHVIRVHADVLPDRHIDTILDDAEVYAALLEEARKDPPLWANLTARFEKRIAERERLLRELQDVALNAEMPPSTEPSPELSEIIVTTEQPGATFPVSEFHTNLVGLLHPPKPETDK